jgi:hypothetical protein
VAGCSLTGSLQVRRGVGGQDAFFAAPSADGRALVLAVADGAGSRERSALGAHLAVDAACRILGRAVPAAAAPPARWSAWATGAANAVADEFARVAHASLADGAQDALATTLVAAVVRPPWAAFMSVGDCFAAVLTRAREADAEAPEDCHLVAPPGKPDFLGGIARSGHWRAFALWEPELSGVVLASDGCGAAALDHPRVHGLPPAAGPLPAPGFYRALAKAARTGQDGPGLFAAVLREAVETRTMDDATVLGAFAAPAANSVR